MMAPGCGIWVNGAERNCIFENSKIPIKNSSFTNTNANDLLTRDGDAILIRGSLSARIIPMG
jgi:hypothetical protein